MELFKIRTTGKRSVRATSALLLAALTVIAAGCNKSEDEKEASEQQVGATKVKDGKLVPAPNTNAEAVPVRTQDAAMKTVTRRVPVTGSIAALQTVSLSPRVSARVVSVLGREGDRVSKGQVVIQQDTTDFKIALDQSRANLQQARAALGQQQANLKTAKSRAAQAETQIKLQRSAANEGVRDAEQQLRSAKESLALAKRPQRTEEIAVAGNQVAQAQANYDKAKSDRERYALLVKEGAAPQITLDGYVNQERVAKAALDTAIQQQNIAREGGRQESIRQAEAAVRRAEANVRLAKSNVGQIQVRRDELDAARSAIAQAQALIDGANATIAQQQAVVRNAEQQIAYASIRSPIDGIISARRTEPGQQAAPGGGLIDVIALDTVYYEASVSEVQSDSIRPGLPVQVRVDAFPGKVFAGRIARLLPTADTANRSFRVRVTIPNQNGALRPGYFARGEVTSEQRQAVVVPKDALTGTDSDTMVFTVRDNKATRHRVKVGLPAGEFIELKSGGIQPGDAVIVAGQDGLKDGASVFINNETESKKPVTEQRAFRGLSSRRAG